MAHCVKVVLEDVCTKSLQQEEASHHTGQSTILLSKTRGRTAVADGNTHLREDTVYNYSDRETPKMIAKVLLLTKNRVCTVRVSLSDRIRCSVMS